MIPMQNITVIYERADKTVYSADSTQFGSVILKRDRNTVQLKSDMKRHLQKIEN